MFPEKRSELPKTAVTLWTAGSSSMKGTWPGHLQIHLSINLRGEQTSLFERALISYSVATGAASFQALEHKITP